MRNFFLFMICFSLLIAEDINTTDEMNTTQFYDKDKVTASTVTENMPTATNDINNTNWNISDWNNYFQKNGANTGVIGNTQALMNSKEAVVSFSANPNLVTSEAVKNNSALNTNPAMTSWDSKTQNEVEQNSLLNAFISATPDGNKIQCYITRDISFQYRCTKTGMVFGGDIDKTGLEARRMCINNCFEQKQCVDVSQGTEPLNIDSGDFKCDAKKDCSFNIETNPTRTLKSINFIVDKNNKYYINLKILFSNGDEKYFLKNLQSTLMDDNTTIYIKNNIKEITLEINNTENNESVQLSKINLEYPASGKFICPTLQDISEEKENEFAYICPSGNVEIFEVAGHTYKICVDGSTRGDNLDGTFSTIDACNSICKVNYECELDMKMFSTDLLHTFREGCIEGQNNCKDEDCKLARLKQDHILSEIVWDATNKATITVKDGTQVDGIKRPRVVIDDDLDFEKRALEEWKDGAYEDMVKNNKYAITKITLGEITEPSSAYNISLIGSSYGVIGTSARTLYWLLKPRNTEVFNNKKYYLYSLIAVTTGYHEYDQTGNLITKRKFIWYLKYQPDDTFKPIRIKLDAGYSMIDENNNTVFVPNNNAEWETKTFIDNHWIDIGENNYAEYFNSDEFSDTKIYWKYDIIDNMGNIIYNLPGLVRSITKDVNGIEETKHYDGSFDGTGDGVLDYKVYTLYSPNLLTYQDIFSAIDNNQVIPIYDMQQSNNYPVELSSDSISNSNIKIYQYGPIEKTSVIVRIKPNEKDIGKKGFIYVFIK